MIKGMDGPTKEEEKEKKKKKETGRLFRGPPATSLKPTPPPPSSSPPPSLSPRLTVPWSGVISAVIHESWRRFSVTDASPEVAACWQWETRQGRQIRLGWQTHIRRKRPPRLGCRRENSETIDLKNASGEKHRRPPGADPRVWGQGSGAAVRTLRWWWQ